MQQLYMLLILMFEIALIVVYIESSLLQVHQKGKK